MTEMLPRPDIRIIWNNIRETDAKRNPYKFVHSEERNIVLIGRSRTGKSTVARVMNDVFHFSTERSLYSETKTVEFNKVTTGTVDNKRYYFNIIDVPGFFDESMDQQSALTNKQVTQFLNDCIRENVCNIHLFAYAFNLAGGIIEKDIDAMLYTKSYFPHLSQNMALIITHCEHYSLEQRNKVIEEFLANPVVQKHNLKQFFKQGIFFLGCLTKEASDQRNIQAVRDEYNNVVAMRNAWIKKCIESSTPFNIHRTGTECVLL